MTQVHPLLHRDQTIAFGDACYYQGVEKRSQNIGKSVTWHVTVKHSKRKALLNKKLGCLTVMPLS